MFYNFFFDDLRMTDRGYESTLHEKVYILWVTSFKRGEIREETSSSSQIFWVDSNKVGIHNVFL